MNRVLTIVLWFFAPTIQMRREIRARVPNAQLPVRFTVVHSLARVPLVLGLVWVIWSGNWYAAAVIAIAMILLALLSRGVTHWLLKRFGGSHAG